MGGIQQTPKDMTKRKEGLQNITPTITKKLTNQKNLMKTKDHHLCKNLMHAKICKESVFLLLVTMLLIF